MEEKYFHAMINNSINRLWYFDNAGKANLTATLNTIRIHAQLCVDGRIL